MSQTSYSIDYPEAYRGLKGDASYDRVESKLVETSAGIEFGLAVTSGTDAERQIDIVGASDPIIGVTLHQHVEKTSAGLAFYAQNESASVLRQGLVWMPVSGTAPAVGAVVYAMVDTAGDEGFATNVAGTNNILIPTAVCKKQSTDPDGATIVLVEINLP